MLISNFKLTFYLKNQIIWLCQKFFCILKKSFFWKNEYVKLSNPELLIFLECFVLLQERIKMASLLPKDITAQPSYPPFSDLMDSWIDD